MFAVIIGRNISGLWSGINLLVVNCFRLKFDDERVTKETLKSALEEQYGGDEEVM